MRQRKTIAVWGLLPFIEYGFLTGLYAIWLAAGERHNWFFVLSGLWVCILGIIAAIKIDNA